MLPLTDEMQQHGARPTWLGYIYVSDVDEKARSIEAAGGKTYMAPNDIPNVGRMAMVADPQGAPFYIMKPIPPEGRENEPSTSSRPATRAAARGTSCRPATRTRRGEFYGDQFGWTIGKVMPMGEMANTSSSTTKG